MKIKETDRKAYLFKFAVDRHSSVYQQFSPQNETLIVIKETVILGGNLKDVISDVL